MRLSFHALGSTGYQLKWSVAPSVWVVATATIVDIPGPGQIFKINLPYLKGPMYVDVDIAIKVALFHKKIDFNLMFN